MVVTLPLLTSLGPYQRACLRGPTAELILCTLSLSGRRDELSVVGTSAYAIHVPGHQLRHIPVPAEHGSGF
jgi:hypothetical protein